MRTLRDAAVRVKLAFSPAGLWRDLPPTARRMLMGGLAGAGVGALSDAEHRGRNAAIGALGGAALGAGGGALYNRLRPTGRAAGPLGATPAPPAPPAVPPERLSFVRDRVEKYRQEAVDYHTWLEGVRQGLHSRDLDVLRGGRKKVLAHPVLYLHADDWMWTGEQQGHAVDQVLKDLGLHGSGTSPTSRAGDAASAWAEAEARRRVAAHPRA